MNKCGITLAQVQAYVADQLEEWLEEEEGIGKLKTRLHDSLSYIVENNLDLEDIQISEAIQDILNNPLYSSEVIRQEFNKNYFLNVLNTIRSGVTLNKIEDTEKLYNVEEVNRRKNASLDFLSAAYGSAIDVKRNAVMQQMQYVVDSCLVGRGNIPGIFGLVQSSKQLNENIRRYQSYLLKQITDYINTQVGENLSKREAELLANPVLYTITQSGSQYTGILEELSQLINQHLNPNKFTPEILRKLYNSNNPNDKKLLQAYNASIFLTHFDTFLSNTLGKSISINKFGLKTGEDKYRISDKTNNLMTTWRTSDEIFVEDEIDNITKLLVTTLKMYEYGSNTPMNDVYLSFGDFTHVIGKLKLLSLNPYAKTLKFDKDFKETYESLWESLTESTKNIIENKTFSELINNIRRNPREILSSVFELLCNEEFTQISNVTEFFSKKDWNFEEKQKLYSLYKGLFSDDNTSLKTIVGNNPNIDYYGFILQASDSIFKNSFVQFYTDEQGNQQTRLLIDLSIYNIKQQFIRDTNAINSKTLNTQYETGTQRLFNIETITNSENKPAQIKFRIPNTNITVVVELSSGGVTYYENNEFKHIEGGILRENEYVVNFLNKILPLNITNDSEIFNILENISDSTFERQLMNFASRVLAVQHIQNTILKGLSGKKQQEEAEKLFGASFKIKYDKSFKQLNVVLDVDTQILNNIANAKAISYGMTTASQVKDSNQASQSLQSFSRLLGSYTSQWDLQIDSNAAAKDLLLLKNPNLFEGHYTINEAFTKGKDGKKTVKFSIPEFVYSSIMFNFVPGFSEFDPKNPRFIQDGHVAFIASVNSDKNTVGLIKTNLNSFVTFNFDGQIINKAIKDLNSQELETFIAQELGTFYINSYNSIENTFSTLTNYIKEIIPGFPGFDYLHNFTEFNKWWEFVTSDPTHGKDWLTYGDSPAEFVKFFTRRYNNNHRLNPITLIDQIHVTNSKFKLQSGREVNTFENNDTLISQIARFKPNFLLAKDPNYPIQSYTDSRTFWKNKKNEVLESLIKGKVRFDLSKNSKENEYLTQTYSDWVTPSKKMILGKVQIDVKGQLKEYTITSKTDLRKIGIETGLSENDIISNPKNKVTLHPILEKYNYLEYLFTQEWMNSTVGSFIAHKGKSKIDTEAEAARFGAQHKRNVSFTAQKQQFILNSLQGISEDYNIAVIEDIKIKKQLLRKSNNSIKPFDGATFVNPFFVHLENFSLCGAKAGINKKQFVHFYDSQTGTGGIIKTAGFGLTNDSIRNSPMDMLMMKKMTSNTWIDENGNPVDIDITKSWDGKNIEYSPIYWQGKDGKYYKLNNIRKSTNLNTYDIKIVQVDKKGNQIGDIIPKTVTINTNYQLWMLFGGARSMSFNGKYLEFSESSIHNVVKAMNSVGEIKVNPRTGSKYNISEISTQDQLWQSLKQSDIAYIVTEGAIKQGGANINSSESFYSTDKRLDFQRIKMYEAGIQLDKEHHATDSELSLPTQIVSACVSKGYSIDEASRLYNSLRQCTEVALKTQLDACADYLKNPGNRTIEQLNEEAFKLVIDNLANSSGNESFATIIAKGIVSAIKADKNLKYSEANFPLSDNTIFRKILSVVSSYLTKQGIRIKIPGLLAVLNPSHNRIKLFGDKKFESFYNPNLQLEELQQSYDSKLLGIHQIDLGRIYKIEYNELDIEYINTPEDERRNLIQNRIKSIMKRRGDETSEEYNERIELETNKEATRLQESNNKKQLYLSIDTPGQLRQLRSQEKNGNISRIREYVKDGRNLSAYNVRFETEKGLKFQLWELDSVTLAHEFAEINENSYNQWVNSKINDEWFKTNFYGLTYKQCKQKINLLVQRDISNLSKTQSSPIQQYNNMVRKLNSGDINLDQFLNFVSLLLYRKVNQNELSTIESEILLLEQVRINGKEHKINRDTIDIQAYEVIMPKTFKEEFGFDTYTDLQEVKNDENWFIKQYIRNKSTILSSQYDVVLKRTNGKHIYLLDASHYTDDLGLTSIQNELMTVEDNGKIFRIDEEGNTLYQLIPGTEVFVDSEGNEVLVITSVEKQNSIQIINQYISEFNFLHIDFSKRLLSTDQNYLKNLLQGLKNNKRVGNHIKNHILSKDINQILENIETYSDDDIDEFNYLDKINEYHPIWIKGREKHTSFLKSLEITAARIPSQSKQSYMAMKVVAYDNPNLNNAYVSTLQILLQGSDFDIDCVSLVTYDIDDSGMLLTWSPYSNLTSKELLEASLKLPIPSGQKVTINENLGNWKECGKFIGKYYKLFDIHYDQGSVVTTLRKIDTVEQFKLLSELVKEQSLTLPDDPAGFFETLKAAGIISIIPTNLEQAVNDLYSTISKFIDDHNLYFNEVSDRNLNKIINNITAYSLHESIIDPVDLIQSQESVDVPTEPIKQIANDPTKSQAAKDAKKSTPGNFINKLESILQNSEGKDGIAISAVALKGFFALTYYYDNILNSGDPKLQRYLINDHGRLLANVRAKDPSTIINQQVVDILVDAGFQEDMAIQLSAMLGLSADNAKELALAKLNAGSKTISIYLYGLSIGLDFEEISSLMMGTTGRIVREVMDDNIFEGIDGYISVKDALAYFEEGPYKNLKHYNISFLNGKQIPSPLTIFEEELKTWLSQQTGSPSSNFGKGGKLIIDFIHYCWKNKINLSEQLKIIENLSNKYTNTDGKFKYLQLLDFVQEYLCQVNDINRKDLEKITFLAEGAQEMKRLGEIAGLNQGLPNDLKSLLSKISKIEDIFVDFASKDQLENIKSVLGSKYIDLERFAFEKKYREKCIYLYDSIKHSFNILHAVATTPHIMGYIKTLAAAKIINTRSYKFRGVINNYKRLHEEFRGTKQDIISGLENYIGDKVVFDWMLYSQKRIKIPSGNYIFLPDGKLSEEPIKEPTVIQLGTDWGNATFKMWMENKVIPDLKQGKIKFKVIESMVSENDFIKDIGANLRTNTVSGNNQIVFSLPINMLPRNDSEQVLLDKYSDSFNSLKQFNYETDYEKHSIVDLFAYYSMIAFNWKQNSNSLVNLFKNSEEFPLIQDLHKFESDLDKSRKNVEDEANFMNNIVPYIASKKGPYSSFGKYTWELDPLTDNRELMIKTQNDSFENVDDNIDEEMLAYQQGRIKNGYTFVSNNKLDPNYFQTTRVRKLTETIYKEYIIENNDGEKHKETFIIQWNKNAGNDEVILGSEVIIKSSDLVDGMLPVKTIDGIMDLDYNKIRSMIIQKLNCK